MQRIPPLINIKIGKTIGVNSCFGSSNIGQMTGFIARKIVKEIPNAFMRCPVSLYPEVEGPTQVMLYDDYQVVIDGCKGKCLGLTYEKFGLSMDLHYALAGYPFLCTENNNRYTWYPFSRLISGVFLYWAYYIPVPYCRVKDDCVKKESKGPS